MFVEALGGPGDQPRADVREDPGREALDGARELLHEGLELASLGLAECPEAPRPAGPSPSQEDDARRHGTSNALWA